MCMKKCGSNDGSHLRVQIQGEVNVGIVEVYMVGSIEMEPPPLVIMYCI